ncbi:response regulator [Phototrophicus methaneseepsis]|uniref:Response regulator n=1 Tax=Phototrophicus methaneseepsis TaxID=2710758 RepID=A0A7S8IG66_9CHLR|nr:response regulator [Phototrophicus methaneseepsis]QPC83668.1 response regulator [Phototrophicus methaneseepsis]
MSTKETEVSDAVFDVVKEILKHLYDYAYLENSDLIQRLKEEIPLESDIRYVHDQVIRAIESLNPGPQTSFHSPHARTYNLLQLHYVEKMLIQDTADELSLSIRQAHRDLRNGEVAIAKMLVKFLSSDHTTDKSTIHTASSVEEEFTNLDSELELTNVFKLIAGACKAVDQLITKHATQVDISSVERTRLVSTNPIVARQILISILARLILHVEDNDIIIIVTETVQEIIINFCYTPKNLDAPYCEIDTTVQNLINILHWDLSQTLDSDGTWKISLHMPSLSTMILIIDDNQALVNLLSRYLSVHNIMAYGISDPHHALEFARTNPPSAIILDVMMPEMDGWELLQNIKNISELAHIPIIICSVLNEPALAFSLGASLFIQKPINQNVVTSALKELQII